MNKRLMLAVGTGLVALTLLAFNARSVSQYKAGDYNHDGVTDARDLSLYLTAYKDNR